MSNTIVVVRPAERADRIALDAATAALRQEIGQLWVMLEVRDAELKERRGNQARLDRLLWQHGTREPIRSTFERLQ